MDQPTAATGLAGLLRALADVPAESRGDIADALATLLVEEPEQLRALAEALEAGASLGPAVEDPVAVVRFADGRERAYATIDDLLPGGLRSLMGDLRIRYLVMLRSQRSHGGAAFGLPADATVEILDQGRAVAELG